MNVRRLLIVSCASAALAGGVWGALDAQGGLQEPARFGFGRAPTSEELRAWDSLVAPDGTGLPEGRATATEGRPVYDARCARCHGATGKEGPHDELAGGGATLAGTSPLKTVGSYWPHATTLWDYVRRSMPFDQPGTMTPDQVYGTVAYVLFLNGIVGEHDPIDRTTLPRIRMPNRDGFVADDRPDVGATAKRPRTGGG